MPSRIAKGKFAQPPERPIAVVEVERRVAQVEKLLAAGTTHREIVEWCRTKSDTKPWSVGDRTACLYMRAVYDRWRAEEQEKRPDYRREMRSKANLVYRQALQHKAYSSAVRALDLMCRMDGLFEPTHHVLEVGPIQEINESDAADRVRHAASTLRLIERCGLLNASKTLDVEAVESKPADAEADHAPPTIN